MRKGGVDYDLIKQIIESIMVSGESKIIVVDSGGNLVSDIPISTLIRTRIYEQDFEDGTTDTTTYGGATQEVQSEEVYSGSHALKVTIPAGTTAGIETPKVAVSPQQLITFSFVHKEDSNINSVKLIITWYRSGGGVIHTEEKELTLTTEWDIVELTAVAPSRSAYMTIKMEATAGSNDGVVYIDDITMDIKGQILRVDRTGKLRVIDTDLIDEIQSKLDISLSALRDALKPTRSTPEQVLSGQSIAAGDKAEFVVSGAEGYSAVVVTVKATYDSSATNGVRIRWLYSPDGTNYDSEEDAEAQGNYEDLSFSAGATRQRTVLIPIFQNYVKVQVVNLDSSYAVTVDVWKTLIR